MTDVVSKRIVDQRVRNRMIEQLEMLVDWPETIAILGARSYFNSFFDWFPDVPPLPSNSVVTVAENRVLTKVLELMDLAASGISDDPTNQELIESGWPSRVAEVAKIALQTMTVRGKLPEDVEAEAPEQNGS